MNLLKLFEIQSGLDYHIVKEKGLEGQNLLEEKILALQVELGECANEWRGFKFWKVNPEPRTKALRQPTMSEEDKEYYNPLLEEYVDCLHFILSIGLELDIRLRYVESSRYEDVVESFNELFKYISELKENASDGITIDIMEGYELLFGLFLGLGEMLGFTIEQIEQAYLDKNKINHERQLNGY